MEEVVHQLQWKKTSRNGPAESWPAAMEEVVDQLQWKKK